MQTVESNQPTYDENENGLVFTGYEFMALPQEKPTEKTMFIIYKGEGTVFGDSSTYIKPENGNARLGDGSETAKDVASTQLSTSEKKHIDLY